MKIARLVLIAGLVVSSAGCEGTPLTVSADRAVPTAQARISPDAMSPVYSTSTDSTATTREGGNTYGSGT